MQRIPQPPLCGHCGRSVGLWEPILAAPGFNEETSWLALSDAPEGLPERIRHLVCPDPDDDRRD